MTKFESNTKLYESNEVLLSFSFWRFIANPVIKAAERNFKVRKSLKFPIAGSTLNTNQDKKALSCRYEVFKVVPVILSMDS